MTKYMIEFKMEDDGKDEVSRTAEIANRVRAELPDAESVKVMALDDEDGIIATCEEA